jgi:O-antigen/teichoic acid export membrane protein
LINKLKFYINTKGVKNQILNSSWLIAEKILRIISALFVGIFVARYLGPTNFGIINYATSFIALFAVISNLGLDEIVIKKLLKNPEENNRILGTTFILKLFGVSITIFLIFVTFFFGINDYKTKLYIGIISISLFFQPFYVIDFYFQSKVQSKNIVKANIISVLITSFLRILLVLFKVQLIYFILLSIFDILIIILGFIYYYISEKKKITEWFFDKKLAIKFLSKSWPLTFSSLVGIIYMRIDQVMLKEMIGFNEVGIYSVAVRLSEIWYFIPVVIGSSIFPVLVNSKNSNEKLYQDRIQGILSLMIVISIGIALIISLLSKNAIVFLYGQSYVDAAFILSIHIWTGVFVFLGVLSSKYLIIENLYKKAFYRTLLGAVINIILNLLLIKKWGGAGAAFSTLIAQIFAAYLYDFFDKKTRKMFYMKTQALFFINFRQNIKNAINEN